MTLVDPFFQMITIQIMVCGLLRGSSFVIPLSTDSYNCIIPTAPLSHQFESNKSRLKITGDDGGESN